MAPSGSEVPTFAVATDVVVLTLRRNRLCVLLLRRAGSVFTSRWALPGGLVHLDESLQNAAYRELSAEAGIAADHVRLVQLGAYGDPGRDPRPGRVVSVAWVALGADLPEPRPDSDADRAEWVPATEALARDLAFDHSVILTDAVEWACSQLEGTTLAAELCRPRFTLPELRRVYEAVWHTELDPRNFQRKVLSAVGFVIDTGELRRGRGRPAPIYRRGPAMRLHPPILRGQSGPPTG